MAGAGSRTAEKPEREGDLEEVGRIRFGEIPQLEKGAEEARARLHELQGDQPILREEVGPAEVAEVVAAWTGIPVDRMIETERQASLLKDMGKLCKVGSSLLEARLDQNLIFSRFYRQGVSAKEERLRILNLVSTTRRLPVV